MSDREDPQASGLTVVNPEELGAPRGYSNGILAPAGGRLLFVAGQVGWDGEQKLVGEGFAEQFGQALGNVVAVVRAAGGSAACIEARHVFPGLEEPEPDGGALPTFQEATRRFQKEFLEKTLEETGWNVTEAARRLDLARSHVYNLIKAFELER